MLTIRKILFPTDFSECAEHAFGHTSFLVRTFGADLHVLTVAVPRQGTSTETDRLLAELDLDVHTIEQQTADLWHPLKKTGASVTFAHEASLSAAEGILDYARQIDADLIVMGTHGRRGLGHAFLGSVAEEVVRRSDCPVLTVGMHASAATMPRVRRLLVPVDFSEYGGGALAYAKELAAVYEAQIDLIHVIEELSMPGPYGSLYTLPAAYPEAHANSLRALGDIGRRLLGEDVPFEVHAIHGNPVIEMVDFAEKHAIDLIVMATHGRTGMRRLFMGSVAERTVRLASCPVFTVKSFGKSLLSESNADAAASMA